MTDPGQPPPGYQPQPYGAQPPQYGGQPGQYAGPPSRYAGPRPTNTMAILSLVFAFVFWPLAIVFGFVAKKQIRERGEGGGGLATAGIVLGFLFLAMTIIAIIAVIALIAHSGTSTPVTGGY